MEEIKSQDEFNQELYNIQTFARDSVSFKSPTVKLPKRINKSQVITAMESPYLNSSLLQEVSMYFKYTNGVYARILNYFSRMMTYDYILYPSKLDAKKSNSEKLSKGYQETASYLDKFSLKHNLGWFAERLFELGELYIYKIEDEAGVIFKEMPSSICRISSVENNVCKYSIDLKAISNNRDLYSTMPKEIQSLTDKYTNGRINEKKLVEKSWYELEENAYAFNIINPFLSKGFPPFTHLFDALMHLDELEQLEFSSAKVDNLKIIHQKLPMDDDGNVLIDVSIARQYHEATKKNLPEGIAITTNPLELQALTLQRSGNQSINHRGNALSTVYNNAGVNYILFNGDVNSRDGVKISTQSDELMSLPVLAMFENFVNCELNKSKKTNAWRVKMLPVTCFNRAEKIQISRENLAYGGSRFEFMANNGFTPLEAINVLKAEQMLGVDELLVPQMTSHTMGAGGIEKKDNGNTRVDKKSNTKETQE